MEVIQDDIINGHEEYSKQQLKKQSLQLNFNYNTIESETYGGLTAGHVGLSPAAGRVGMSLNTIN